MTKNNSIIEMNYSKTKKHKPMSIYNRSAQFSPFAALVGYSGVIEEKGRSTEDKIEINEDLKIEIDRILQNAKDNNNIRINIVYYIKDDKKEGGSYLSIENSIKKIDEDSRIIYMQDGYAIPIEDIVYASLM